MLYNVWKYLKNPVYRTYRNAPIAYKKTIFLFSLKWNLLLGFSLVLFNHTLSQMFGINMGEHATEKLFADSSAWVIFLTVCVMAPILEEVFFRGPLVYFKDSLYFKHAFYTSILLFGVVHFFNFKGDDQLLFFMPLLIAPQLVTGVFLGYIRVKLGLKWSILLHATFNAILIGPVLLTKFLNIPMK